MLSPALFALVASSAEPVATPSVDVPLMVGSAGLFLGLYLGEEREQEYLFPPYAPPSGIDSLARSELHKNIDVISTAALYGTLGTALVVDVLNAGPEHRDDRALLYSEALLVDGALVELTKWAVRRPRPYTATETTGTPDDSLSFPSGHTAWMATVAFTTARSIDLTTDVSPGQRVLLYGTAGALTAGMGILRVAAGVHHPSDVIAGGCIGAAVGWLVPELHRTGAGVQVGAMVGIGPQLVVSGTL